MSFIDFQESEETKKAKSWLVIFLVLGVAISYFVVKSTLAANITINSGMNVEFGQGMSATTACSGASSLTVTPNSAFTNSTGSTGTFYFKSVTVSGIPASCNGYDFQISAYDSTTGTSALSLFGSTNSVASIYDNAGTFQAGHASTGSSISNSPGTFTVTFATPVATANAVSKLTLQSVNHVAFSCVSDGICVVGDIGPGGGTVFFVSVAAFSETGTACNTNCHALEWAPNTWNGTAPDPGQLWSSDTTHVSGAIGSDTGTGFTNTQIMLTSSGSYVADSSAAAFKARAYAGTDSSAGQWFLPSFAELITMFSVSGKKTDATGVGGFADMDYWASTETAAGSARSINFSYTSGSQNSNGKAASNIKVRPIRAF